MDDGGYGTPDEHDDPQDRALRYRPHRPLRTAGGVVVAVAAVWTALSWLGAWYAAQRTGDALVDARNGLRGWYLLVALAALLSTAHWLGRAHDVASWLDPASQRNGRTATWLAWVVPFVSLWWPKRVVDDVWSALARLPGRAAKPRTWVWWLAWLVTYVNTPLRTYPPGPTPREAFWVAVLTTVAFALWTWVVVGITRAHDGPPVAAEPVAGTAQA